MNQAGIMERAARTEQRREPARAKRALADPRPVTDRVAQFESDRRRATESRPLPSWLLTLAQRAGRHPWFPPIGAAVLGVLSAAAQRVVTWSPFVFFAAVLVLAIAVVAVATIVRRRVHSGAPLRTQELVIDTDQAIPACAMAPVGMLVGWVAGTLFF